MRLWCICGPGWDNCNRIEKKCNCDIRFNHLAIRARGGGGGVMKMEVSAARTCNQS